MPETLALKLTVYQPAVLAVADEGFTAEVEQVGFEYDLEILVPDLHSAATGDAAQASSARCEVVPVTGTLSFPNPAAPVIAPFTGAIFIYDNAPAIGFPLTLMAQSSGDRLGFAMNMAFPASPVDFYSGAIRFDDWPGPFRNVTASFLCPK